MESTSGHPDIAATKLSFLDFAVGMVYHRPVIGVEPSLKETWDFEEITYNILKLIDPTLPFGRKRSVDGRPRLFQSSGPVFRRGSDLDPRTRVVPFDSTE